MRTKEEIERDIKRLARQSYWVGAALGLLVGFGAGFMVSQLTVERVVVIPMQQGIEV